jgi:hypothetical protein
MQIKKAHMQARAGMHSHGLGVQGLLGAGIKRLLDSLIGGVHDKFQNNGKNAKAYFTLYPLSIAKACADD